MMEMACFVGPAGLGRGRLGAATAPGCWRTGGTARHASRPLGRSARGGDRRRDGRREPGGRDAPGRLQAWIKVGRIPDIVEFGKVMRDLASDGDLASVQEAMILLRELDIPANEYIVLELMRCHMNAAGGPNADAAYQVLEEAVRESVPVNARHYNMLFTHHLKRGRYNLVYSLRKHMRKQGIEPDLVTYVAIITAAAKTRDLKTGERVWRELQKSDIEPSEWIYGAMIELYGAAGRIAPAERIFRQYLAALPPSTYMFTRMISSYAQAGQRRKATECFDQMKQLGLEPSQVTYNALLRSETRYGSVKSAGTILRTMIKRGEKPDIYTFVALIDAFGRERNTDKALEVFMLIRESGEVPTVKTYNTVLTACFRGDDIANAMKVIENMRLSNVQPDVVTYNLLIGAFARTRDLKRMWQTYEAMTNDNITPDVRTFTLMLTAFVEDKRYKVADELFRKCTDNKAVGKTPSLYTSYARVLMDAEMYREALQAIWRLREKRIRHTLTSIRMRGALYSKLKARGELTELELEREKADEKADAEEARDDPDGDVPDVSDDGLDVSDDGLPMDSSGSAVSAGEDEEDELLEGVEPTGNAGEGGLGDGLAMDMPEPAMPMDAVDDPFDDAEPTIGAADHHLVGTAAGKTVEPAPRSSSDDEFRELIDAMEGLEPVDLEDEEPAQGRGPAWWSDVLEDDGDTGLRGQPEETGSSAFLDDLSDLDGQVGAPKSTEGRGTKPTRTPSRRKKAEDPPPRGAHEAEPG